jgi:hypothetical protein
MLGKSGSIDTTAGSAGGGSAQTLITGKMAKAAINPQLRNLPIVTTRSVSSYNVTKQISIGCELNHQE